MLKVTAFLMSSIMSTVVLAQAKNSWDGYNNPYKLDANFEARLDALPAKGDIGAKGLAWPGYYWANNKGGIAQRWSAKNPQNFKYKSPSLYDLKQMPAGKINELSPAEKYDIFVGAYDYPTVKTVWANTRSGASEWTGICHGVAPASLHHPEPKSVTLTNADGITVTFFASDVKALLAYYYAKESDSNVTQVGKRCFVNGRLPLVRSISACQDVHPASLHIIMANRLGLSKVGFIADMDRYHQVWNHAAVSYESTISGRMALDKNAAESAVSRVKVTTKVKYTGNVDPAMTPMIGSDLAKYDTRTYVYYLELNSRGEIVGGEWISSERPDFLWYKEKDEFKDYWSGLNQIYYPAH
jgi:hypothetical protein